MSHSMEHPSGYEKRDVSVRNVAVWTFILVIFLVIGFVALDDWFIKTKEEMYNEMVLKPVNPELLELRAKEDSLLSSYGKFDTLSGVFHIPIDSAMKQMADEAASKSAKK